MSTPTASLDDRIREALAPFEGRKATTEVMEEMGKAVMKVFRSVSAEAAEAYSKFHREWGEAVGTPGYDKEAWKAKQIELFGKKGRP
jgi:hypothetical protein